MNDKEKFRETIAGFCCDTFSRPRVVYDDLSEKRKEAYRGVADEIMRLYIDNSCVLEIIELGKIRVALGVGMLTMLSELPAIAQQIKNDAERYELVRSLSAAEFEKIKHWQTTGENTGSYFDLFIDELIHKRKAENP